MSGPRATDGAQTGAQGRGLWAVRKFVAKLLEGQQPWSGQNRREAQRHPYVSEVEIMPVDAGTRQPIESELRQAVSRDLSSGGIAVVCRGYVDWPELALRLSRTHGESVLVRAKVLRVRPVGQNHYEIGCMFVDKVDESS